MVRTDRLLRPAFQGVFPADRLPTTHRSGTGLIVNTDPSDRPGMHWVAMYWDNEGRAEFFDSYGQTPQSYHPSWGDYLGRGCRYSTRSLQSPRTTVCGHYCLYYLTHRVRGRTLKEIVVTFPGPPRVNDRREEEGFDPRLKTPSNLQVVGPSKSGKTHWVRRLIQERQEMFRQPLSRVVYCYGEWQPMFDTFPEEVEWVKGMPEDFYEKFEGQPGLLVLDDLMAECSNNDAVEKLFTRGSHHRQLTTVLLTQNLFRKGQRMQSLNAHYVVAFKNPRDRSQMAFLFRQAFPKQKHPEEAFKDATDQPYGYLLFDFETDTSETLRLRTNIFPTDTGAQEVYVNKEWMK
ncbi:hypothetical protein QZH41_020165 [Actinostola sp. cb2023]|nr:hypothetical protein QZH41_020165 [Actinostola sp. cb2023]